MIVSVKLDYGAHFPRKAYDDDAGFDLFTREDFIVPADGSAVCDTGVHLAIPRGYCGLLVSKSGLNVKFEITSTGLVDSGYTGSIIVKLYNNDSGHDKAFRAGDKITQIVILPIPDVELVETDYLPSTERDKNGFGSSGR